MVTIAGNYIRLCDSEGTKGYDMFVKKDAIAMLRSMTSILYDEPQYSIMVFGEEKNISRKDYDKLMEILTGVI